MSSRKSRGIYMGSTQIAASKTISEITDVLVKAKAREMHTEFRDGKPVALSFALEIQGASGLQWFRLPCRAQRLAPYVSGGIDQAERVAWRQILRWIQAQAALIETKMVAAHEVFMPYAMGANEHTTMFEVWEAQIKMIEAPKGAKSS